MDLPTITATKSKQTIIVVFIFCLLCFNVVIAIIVVVAFIALEMVSNALLLFLCFG